MLSAHLRSAAAQMHAMIENENSISQEEVSRLRDFLEHCVSEAADLEARVSELVSRTHGIGSM